MKRIKFTLKVVSIFAAIFLLAISCSLALNRSTVTTQTVRFVVFADTKGVKNGVNTQILGKTLQEIKSLQPKPQYIIVPGDLVEGSKNPKTLTAQLLNFKGIYSTYFPIKSLLPGVGNHEDGYSTSNEAVFPRVFSEFKASQLGAYNKTVYYVDLGNTRLIMLNSNHPKENGKVSDKQLEWLRQVTKGRQKHNIIFVHEPAFPTGAHVGTSLDGNPAQRDKFWKIVDSNNVDLVFAGHEHNYSRKLIDSTFSTKNATFKRKIYQVVSGTAGAPPYKQYTATKGVVVAPKPVYNYVVVDVEGAKVKVRAYSLGGKLIDQFNLETY